MSVPISESLFAAFAAEAERGVRAAFTGWWHEHVDLLGPFPAHHDALVEQAFDFAEQQGFADNAENRVYLQAAAMKLMPNADGRQLVLALDAILLREPDRNRLVRLITIAQGRG